MTPKASREFDVTGVQWLVALGIATIVGLIGTGALALWILYG